MKKKAILYCFMNFLDIFFLNEILMTLKNGNLLNFIIKKKAGKPIYFNFFGFFAEKLIKLFFNKESS